MQSTRRFALLAVLAVFGLTGLWACAASRTAEPADAERTAPTEGASDEGAPAASAPAPGQVDEAPAPAQESAGGGHPEVPAEADCFGCHQDISPEVAREWQESPHGMALVKCFVCHGSTGEDFEADPGATSCSSCHPEEADSVAGANCFGCHGPHTLAAQGENPHLEGGAR